MATALRPILGDYMSTECFRYLRLGAEDTAGRAMIVSAGKTRGHSLTEMLNGLDKQDGAGITKKIAGVLGLEGTRLCLVKEVKPTPEGYEVHITESACVSGVKSDVPMCAYTLGVFIGALEEIAGERLFGQETECTAAGHNECVYKLEYIR